jgi:hypothetical protein
MQFRTSPSTIRFLSCLTKPLAAVTLFTSMNEDSHMNTPGGDPFASPVQREQAVQFPKVWIGYVLSLVTFFGEVYAVGQNPDLAKNGGPPPLSIYLPAFVSVVYWLVCVHRYHVILGRVNGWVHPISPNRAVWFHFIPLYNIYWITRWPEAMAQFVNWRMQAREMKAWVVAVGIMASIVCRIFVDTAIGLVLLFVTCSYITEKLRKALAAPAPQVA